MNFLAIDIGNSHTLMVLFRHRQVAGEWRMASSRGYQQKILLAHIDLFCSETATDLSAIAGIGISSVVPDLTRAFVRALRRRTNTVPVLISGTLPLPVFIRYEHPERLGADRICGIVGAREKFGRGPLIIVDFGTATTYDVISGGGIYLGGAIAPGMGTVAEALSLKTAALGIPPLEFPPHAIGRNTTQCLQSGILFGAVDAFEGMIRRLRSAVGKRARVIATGGFAGLIASQTKLIDAVEPFLVPEGILSIHRNATKHLHRRTQRRRKR
jgi:type III pantothenate kinase